MKEKNKNGNYEKTYISSLIITYIAKIIVKDFLGNDNNDKINNSHLVRGIFTNLLYDLLKGNLSDEAYKNFCEEYIKKTNNKKDRSFPRTSKTPFTKWYVKKYSNNAALIKIILAILNDTADELPKNLKTKAKRIKKINGKEV
jgi:hypothetical protein